VVVLEVLLLACFCFSMAASALMRPFEPSWCPGSI
jgi:hypothetical protein